MRAILQRVREAAVLIDGQVTASIGPGLLVFVGIQDSDRQEDIPWLAGKIVRMRLFNDNDGLMNRSLLDVQGELLVVSQFTLFASTKKGNRPSHTRAARPEKAVPYYEALVAALTAELRRPVPTGTFGAQMDVRLVNDGPVTILLDSQARE